MFIKPPNNILHERVILYLEYLQEMGLYNTEMC